MQKKEDMQHSPTNQDMDQDIHMLLENTITLLIIKLEPLLYWKYIWKFKVSQCCMWNWRRLYMGQYRWLFFLETPIKYVDKLEI